MTVEAIPEASEDLALEPADGSAAQLIILLHSGRCGSTVLGDVMGQSPLLAWDRGIFSKTRNLPLPVDENGAVRWLEHIEDRRRRCRMPYLGIEVRMLQILEEKLFGETLAESLDKLKELTPFPLIFLCRENLLERR